VNISQLKLRSEKFDDDDDNDDDYNDDDDDDDNNNNTRYIPRLCGLVVRVSGYRYRGPGFDSWRYQIF
jgi:hypothetical protein